MFVQIVRRSCEEVEWDFELIKENSMADYKIGQILTSTEEVEIEKALSGERVKIPKGI